MKRILLYIGLALFCLTISSGAWMMGPGTGPGIIAPVQGTGIPTGDSLLLESATNFFLLQTGDFLLLE